MDITQIDDLYVPSTISLVEMINSHEISNIYSDNANIDNYLINKLTKKICNKCNHTGYINNEIFILNRSIGKLKSIHFDGAIYYNIKLKINICVPLIGANIICEVKGKNEAGALCEAEPFKIMICSDIDDISDIEIGDKLVIEIINFKILINEKNIKVLGRLKKKHL